jgi:threonine dehydratase
MSDTVKEPMLARVYDVAIKTPIEPAEALTKRLGGTVWLKREDLQPIHSFKLRGAYNKMASLSKRERAAGVIAASAGNHAQGVALSAKKLGISALIVMPRTTPAIKVDAVKAYGGLVELSGDNYSEAADHCKARTKDTGRTYIHPFDDPLVIAGQGTIGGEILDQLPAVTHVFVPVGGGGLIAGIAQCIKALRPDVQIISVEPEDSSCLATAMAAGKPVELTHVGIFADGVAVKQIGDNTFEICRALVDSCITVSTDELCAGIKAVYAETRSIVEPAGALGVAGIVKYAAAHDMTNVTAIAVCSGANMSFERLQFVAERTLLGSGKESLFSVTIPQTPGALEDFCCDVVNGHAITQFGYRLNGRDQANIFVGITVSRDEKASFSHKLTVHGYQHFDLSYDDMAKEHVRHMIGGASAEAHDERLYEVSFPERPGALLNFLQHVGAEWNISLFHYRGMGGDTGRVLVGFEANDSHALETKLRSAKYDFERVDSVAVQLYLGQSTHVARVS